MPIEPEDLKRGRAFRGKRPSQTRGGLVNDRVILYVGETQVQYDSPAVAMGRRYPTVAKEDFIQWASHDITDELPEGQFALWDDYQEEILRSLKGKLDSGEVENLAKQYSPGEVFLPEEVWGDGNGVLFRCMALIHTTCGVKAALRRGRSGRGPLRQRGIIPPKGWKRVNTRDGECCVGESHG